MGRFWRTRTAALAAILLGILPAACLAQITITGAFGGVTADGSVVAISFACTGAPVCAGTYSGTIHDPGCSNGFAVAGAMSIDGVALTTGAFQGKIVVANADQDDVPNPDGTCSVRPGTGNGSATLTYTAHLSGSGGTLSVTQAGEGGQPATLPGTFVVSSGSIAPVPFPLTVTSNITATTANATAVIQYPASDVGKNSNVYVFAYAPKSRLKSAAFAPKDDTSSCVLAQLDPSGQLVAVSNSGLQPYVSGVLSAQGQSVTILNNASTPQIAGSTFFVGYGQSSANMISGGVDRNAVSVPGDPQCPSAFPASPAALSGLWYNASESGWGVHFTQRRNVIFTAWYTYDANGGPKWYVADNCAMASENATSGRCTGALYQVSGPAFFGATFNAGLEHVLQAGTLQVDFTDASHATLTYTVGSTSRSVAIQRQLFATGTTPPAVDYTDLWWNPSESGWGMAISHQYSIMFLAWFVYDASGNPVWYVVPNCAVSGNSCSGDLYRTKGPPLGTSFDPAKVQATAAGKAGVVFSDPNDGVLTFTVDGVTNSKSVTRQTF